MATFFKPPADIDDATLSGLDGDARDELRRKLRENWHEFIASRIHDRDENLFYDESVEPGGEPIPVPWDAFPLSIWNFFNADSDPAGRQRALEAADTLRPFVYLVSGGQTFPVQWTPQTPAVRPVVNGQLGPDVLRPYLRDGLNLAAFRLSKNRDSGSIRPVMLTYTDDEPMIPIRPTAVAANDDMGILVWVLGSARAVPTTVKGPPEPTMSTSSSNSLGSSVYEASRPGL